MKKKNIYVKCHWVQVSKLGIYTAYYLLKKTDWLHSVGSQSARELTEVHHEILTGNPDCKLLE